MSFLWIPKSIRHRTEYSFFYENVELPTKCISYVVLNVMWR